MLSPPGPAVSGAWPRLSHMKLTSGTNRRRRYAAASMSTRAEFAALLAAPVGLLLTRAVGFSPGAVWFAAAVFILIPGWCCVRMLRLDGVLGRAGAAPSAATLGLAVWAPPLAVAFAFHLPFGFTLAVVLAATVVLAGFTLREPLRFAPTKPYELLAGAALAVVFGFLSWRLSTGVIGDALFHVGRMRKILGVPDLTLSDISSFKNGPPHAGYAFPLLHAAFAGVAWLAGVDVVTSFIYLLPLCAVVAIIGAYAVGVALTGWRTAGYLAALLTAWDLFTLINGLVMQINQPPPFTFWVLLPAAVLAYIAVLKGVRTAAPAALAAVVTIALVHPTYAIPWLAIAAGLVVAAWRAHTSIPRIAIGTLAAATAISAMIALWIYWIASRGGGRHTILTHSDEFVHNGTRATLMYPWAPVYGRGAVLAGIVLSPLLARYRTLLPIAGAMLGLLLLLLTPGLNTLLIPVVGMGQFHRFWQVLPWPVAVAAGCCVLARYLGRWAWPVALVVAAVSYYLRGDQVFWREPTSFVVVAAILATLVSFAWPQRSSILRGPVLTSTALVLAILFGQLHHGLGTVLDEMRDGPHRSPPSALAVLISPGAVQFFRAHDHPIPVVLGEEHRLYELIGYANIYAQALPEARTRAEPKAQAPERRKDEIEFFTPGTSDARRAEILNRWGVDYVMVDLRGQKDVAPEILNDPQLQLVYTDPPGVPSTLGRFAILRVRR